MRLRNDQPRPISLILEPWGETYPIPAGAEYDLVPEGDLELDFGDGKITVYAASGTSMRLFCDDRELGGSRLRAPTIPKGMTMRQFVADYFRTRTIPPETASARTSTATRSLETPGPSAQI